MNTEEIIDCLARELETVRFHLCRGDFEGNKSLAGQAASSIAKTLALLERPEGDVDRWQFRPQAPAAHFADGENPCVLEWGAVSLPLGDASRVTNLKLCATLWDAIAEGALCGFDWRVYPMANLSASAALDNRTPEERSQRYAIGI